MSSSSYPSIYYGTLLDELSHEQKLSSKMVKKLAREVFVIIEEGLMRDGVVRINHFGSFKLKRVAAKNGRNPQTGKSIFIPGHAKVVFTPCKALREMIEPTHSKPIPIPALMPATESVPATKPPVTKPPVAKLPVTELPITKPHVAKLSVTELPITQPHVAKPPVTELPITKPQVPPSLKEASQPVFERVSKPESLNIESEETTIFEQVPEGRKVAGRDKFVYLGLAAIIIAVLVFKNMPRRPPPQSITVPQVSETTAVIQQERQTAERISALPIDDEVVATEKSQPQILAESTFDEEVSTVVPVIEKVTAPIFVEQAVVAEVFFTERPYKLVAGNSLWRLSKHFYNTPFYWPYIFYANSETITDPDKLLEGRTITMPLLEGRPGGLTTNDREGIAEGYFLVYTVYKESGHPDAFFALLEAKRYSAEVVERKRHTLTLSKIESMILDRQEVITNL